MGMTTDGLIELTALLLAAAAAFVGLAAVDAGAATDARRRWLKRGGTTVALTLSALAADLPRGQALLELPGLPAGVALLLAGALAAALVIEQRQRTAMFYLLAALPCAALLAAGLHALLPADSAGTPLPAQALAAGTYLLLATLATLLLAGRFRRRRGGSPLPLLGAASLLWVGGLWLPRIAWQPAQAAAEPGTLLPLLVLGVLLCLLALRMAAPRWQAEREAGGGLRRGGRTEPISGLPVLDVAAESFVRVQRLAVASRSACAVVVLDFAALERILATQGKAERDRLYANAAWHLRSARRDEELIAALGEQRFLLVLRVTDATQATARVRELLAMFEQPLGDGEARVRLRPGAGISLWPEHGEDFGRLLANALVALERCPPGGLQLFHATQREQSEQRLRVETTLGRALAEGEIGLVLQPIIDALSGDVRMVELLARWNHPELGNIAPREFILVAEASGAIGEFDRWLLRQAIATTKWLDAADLGRIRVALNCSPVNLTDASFLDDFERLVLDSGIDPARLEVEVTEAALAEGERAVIDSLVRLRSLGVGLTIDDFGIGHSSLARLRDLPIDTLKIDQSFIRDMDHPKGEFLVSGILGLAHGLGKAVIAEGVETRAQRSALSDLGCEYLQGFLISKPLSWRGLLDFLGAETGEPRPGAPPPPAEVASGAD